MITTTKGGMRRGRWLLAALLGVTGMLAVSGTASAAVTGFTYTDTISPQKQSAKTFGPAALHNSLDTTYTGGFAPTPTTTVVQFSKDIKFTAGTLPQCNLNSISTVPDTPAMSLCGASKLGTGSVVVNGGVLTGKVTAYNGGRAAAACRRSVSIPTCSLRTAPMRSAQPGSAPWIPRRTR